MRSSIVFVSVVLCLSTGSLWAGPAVVEVLSEQYTISGWIEYALWPPQTPDGYGTGEYHVSGGTECSEMVSPPPGYSGSAAMSAAKRFFVAAEVLGVTEYYGTASAEAAWIFRPRCTDLWIDCWGVGSNGTYLVSLKDLSTGEDLFSSSGFAFKMDALLMDNSSLAGATPVLPYQFDLTHTYELTVAVDLLSSDEHECLELKANLTGTPIPAPGALLLSTFGMGLIGRMRRRNVNGLDLFVCRRSD